MVNITKVIIGFVSIAAAGLLPMLQAYAQVNPTPSVQLALSVVGAIALYSAKPPEKK